MFHTNIFQDKVASDWQDSQGHLVAIGYEPRYLVFTSKEFYAGQTRWVVAIHDRDGSNDEADNMFSIYLSTEKAAKLVAEALQDEVDGFDMEIMAYEDTAGAHMNAIASSNASAAVGRWS